MHEKDMVDVRVQQQAEHDRRISLGKESKSDAVRQLRANPDPDPSPNPNPNPKPNPKPFPDPHPNPNPNHDQIRRLGGDVSSLSKQMGEMHGSVSGLASALAAIQQHLEGGGRGGSGRSLPCQRPPGEAASGAAGADAAGAGVGAACAAMAAGGGNRPPPARSSAGGCAFCSAVSGAVGSSASGPPMTAEARLERLEATVSKLAVSLQSLLGQSPPGKRASRLQRLMTPPPHRPPTGSASANHSPLEA